MIISRETAPPVKEVLEYRTEERCNALSDLLGQLAARGVGSARIDKEMLIFAVFRPERIEKCLALGAFESCLKQPLHRHADGSIARLFPRKPPVRARSGSCFRIQR